MKNLSALLFLLLAISLVAKEGTSQIILPAQPQIALETAVGGQGSTLHIDLDRYANAIRKAENNPNYGIISIPCNSEAQCRQYCKNTVFNTLVKYRSTRCKEGEDDLSCLARRYAPIGAKNDPNNLNKNWKRNVKYFYDKER